MSPKVLILSLVIFLIAVVGLSFLFASQQKPQPATASFTTEETDRPRAEIDRAFYDLGEMKVSEVKQQDYVLKNTGSKPLQITNVNSSCGCTSGQIIYKGTTSKEFSMHSQSGYVTEIAPGDTATVRLIYRPATMPVYGVVEREVYVTTNDPVKQKLSFSIRVKVN